MRYAYCTLHALDYYPLPGTGERFPVNNAQLEPELQPRPGSDVEFLHGMLQGLARIEAAGYARLAGLGAPRIERVISSGGGAKMKSGRKSGKGIWVCRSLRRPMLKPHMEARCWQETGACAGARFIAPLQLTTTC
ncbi:MAG: hypothetical protein NUV63_13825 [Gallionella sp.]|nr:hypothetical protein [Gallionella sp.]